MELMSGAVANKVENNIAGTMLRARSDWISVSVTLFYYFFIIDLAALLFLYYCAHCNMLLFL